MGELMYHFTSPERLELIRLSGFIRTTESNIGSPNPAWVPYGEHVGPDVVWLTDVPRPRAKAIALDVTLDGTDKTAVRITVDVDAEDLTWWPDFRRRHGIHREWRRHLERGRDPDSWWVVEHPIPVESFVEVVNT